MIPKWQSITRLNHHKIYGRIGEPLADLEAVRALKREGPGVLHGQRKQYTRGCRCDDCLEWGRAFRAQRKRGAA